MACFSPLKAYQLWNPLGSEKSPISFKNNGGTPIQLPCGQCVGCRLERSRQWAIRCTHEASLYKSNCFITLTYNNENLPSDHSLDKTHFQKFMKRLRFRFGPNIRFFHCGEYGEKFGRPHYHACLFNFDFPDKKPWKTSSASTENMMYTSEILNELWPYGFSSIGSVTFQSAAYVARYIMKKVTGKNAHLHYETTDDYGVVTYRTPEYTTMSRRPGIGKGWFDKYSSDVYPDDFVVMNQKKMRPPRYYDNQFEVTNPSLHSEIKAERELKASKQVDNNTPERLIVREKVQLSKLKQLTRPVG